MNPVTGTVQLTNNVSGEIRSVFDDTPQSVSQFTASFVFQAVGMPNNTSSFGASFILFNGSPNTVAESAEGIPDVFGLTDWRGVFYDGAAISLEYYSSLSATALYDNPGAGVSGSVSSSPVNLFSGDPIDVTLTYNGSILHENLLDATTFAAYDAYYVANIPSIIGSSTAYVGFTANTTNAAGTMDFSNLQFTTSPVPEPSTLALLSVGAAGLVFAIRRKSSLTFTAATAIRR